MTTDEMRAVVLEVLGDVAPEIDPAEVSDETDFRDDLELDSMDFLNLVIGLHERLGVEIPEADYPALATLGGCTRYLVEKSAASS
jgi:acyl carrier protein